MSPSSLQEMAMKALVGFFSAFCYECSMNGDLVELRQVVAHIKKNLDPRIPCNLVADIYNKFLEKYSWPQEKVVLDIVMVIIMDRKIIGLKCSGKYLDSLDFNQLSRIQGLQELELTTRLVHLAGLSLGDLKKLTYQAKCTNSDLKVIGQNCPRLEYLDVSNSKKVTDVGLRALSPCKNLNSVVASRCLISLSGINDLLSANENIRKLSAWPHDSSGHEGFDFFQPSALSVYPSIESFAFGQVFTGRSLLESLPALSKFPNLRSIIISGYVREDLSILRSLSQLSEVELRCDPNCTWDNLQAILRYFGAMIKKLSFTSSAYLDGSQSELNYILEFCGDIEYLKVQFRFPRSRGILSIPSFRKLKSLVLHNIIKAGKETLNFGNSPELEELVLNKFGISTKTIESLIFDKTKCPNLKHLSLREYCYHNSDVGPMIKRIEEDKKLNSNIRYPVISHRWAFW